MFRHLLVQLLRCYLEGMEEGEKSGQEHTRIGWPRNEENGGQERSRIRWSRVKKNRVAKSEGE